MAPRRKWDAFATSEPVVKQSLHGGPDHVRAYVTCACPYCDWVSGDIPEDRIEFDKGGIVRKHLEEAPECAAQFGEFRVKPRKRRATSAEEGSTSGVTEDTHPSLTSPSPTNVDTLQRNDALSFVYGLFFLPLELYIYVGSTDEFDVREGAHFSYRGGARRVAIVFAQQWFQPLKDFFRLDKLWTGVAEKTELRAIEQYFMNKYETRVQNRSREPTLSRDLDLMDKTTPPRQLNINRACADEALVAAAAARVKHDLQLAVVPTQREQMLVSHMTDYLWCAASAVEPAVPVLLRQLVAKYQAAEGAHRIPVAEVHGDLVRVRNTATDSDGSDFHWLLKAELVKYSTDRNPDGTWPPRMIAGIFIALADAQGLDSVVDEKWDEDEEAENLKRKLLEVFIVPEHLRDNSNVQALYDYYVKGIHAIFNGEPEPPFPTFDEDSYEGEKPDRA